MVESPSDKVACLGGVRALNDLVHGAVDEEMKEAVVSSRYSAAQAGLLRPPRLALRKMSSLFEKFAVKGHVELCAGCSQFGPLAVPEIRPIRNIRGFQRRSDRVLYRLDLRPDPVVVWSIFSDNDPDMESRISRRVQVGLDFDLFDLGPLWQPEFLEVESLRDALFKFHDLMIPWKLVDFKSPRPGGPSGLGNDALHRLRDLDQMAGRTITEL